MEKVNGRSFVCTVFFCTSVLFLYCLNRQVNYVLVSQPETKLSPGQTNLLFDSRRKIFYGVKYKKDYDILRTKQFPFLPNYKNPCWYHDGILRCIPYLHLIGAPKCGTTDLWDRLKTHPEFVDPRMKGSYWLSWRRFYREDESSLDFYIDMYTRKTAHVIARNTTFSRSKNATYHNLITGDADTTNMYENDFWPILPGNEGFTEPRYTNADYLHHIYSGTKIIVLLRNPIDRTYSDYFHHLGKTYERQFTMSAQDFHARVSHSIQIYRHCFQRTSPRSCAYNKTIALLSHDEIRLRGGLYSIYMEDFLHVFPKKQILVLRLEDYEADVAATLQSVFKFLEMSPMSKSEMERALSLPRSRQRGQEAANCGPMLNATRELLHRFFLPFNNQLAALLSDSRFKFEK